ncbi:MAG: hypothetical protein E5X28_13505, partial [Mesorhizobium sp.]
MLHTQLDRSRSARFLLKCAQQDVSCLTTDAIEGTMLNFDEARFVRIQSGAVALRERIETAVAQC